MEATDLLRLVLEILESHFHHTGGQSKSQDQPRLKVIIFSKDLPDYSIFKISSTNKYTHKPSGSSTFLVLPIFFFL